MFNIPYSVRGFKCFLYAIVAVGMIGCKKARAVFMRGYNEMLNYICPEKVIVFGNPFPEMQGNLIAVDYQSSRKVVR